MRAIETVSIGVQNLCAPCGCACKYCLLQSYKRADGVDYFRGKKLAERFVEWGKSKKLPQLPYYYISYCAEYPELYDNIAFNRSVGFAGAAFLQCNGIQIRNQAKTDAFVSKLKSAGIESIDTTFFGNERYHDRFAARSGDFAFMLRLAASAARHQIACSLTVVVTEESKDMLDDLLDVLSETAGANTIHSFLPDYRGRGYLLEDSRLTLKSYESLSDRVKSTMNMKPYKTQSEWLSGCKLGEYTKRDLTITLRSDNIELFERMTCAEIVSYVEKLDDDYYSAIPTINELAQLYGDKDNTRLYRLRDLFWMWQKRYIQDNHIDIYDVTDERLCNTVRS